MFRYLATLALLVAPSGCKQESGQVSVPVNLVSTGQTTVIGKGVMVAATPTSISVGIATPNHEDNPPYALMPTVTPDGNHLRISATTALPDGTLYRLGVRREIAIVPDPKGGPMQASAMFTHAGGFIPGDPVELPEEGLPMNMESFIPVAGRIQGGKLEAVVEMFPRHVQLFGADEEPERYTPNADEVEVVIAVERDLPGQVKTLTWPEGTERFVWRQMTPCALPEKASAE